MRNLCGPPVYGDDFIFRERELRFASAAVRDGNSVLVFGLRRVGKTSFLLELARRLREQHGVRTSFLDVEDKSSATEFFTALLDALPPELGQRFTRTAAKARTLPQRLLGALQRRLDRGGLPGFGFQLKDEVVDYWKPLSEALAEAWSGHPEPTVLLIDELPFFLENLVARDYPRSAVGEILATLRSWRARHLPMVLAGSRSLDAMLEDCDLSQRLLNDLTRVSLPPLSADESRELLARLRQSNDLQSWSEDTIEAVVEHVDDTHPFFLQCAFRHLSVEDRGDRAYVEQVFRRDVLPDLRRTFFAQFDEQLSRNYLPADRRDAERLLDALAEADDRGVEYGRLCTTVTEPQDPGALLRRLAIHDLAVEMDDGHWGLSSRVVRRWRQSRGARGRGASG